MPMVIASSEFIPAGHIAATLSVPIGIVIFVGAVFMLLWSNYGAKKGAAIYATAFFGFNLMLGVFWWFGAPGTPPATGLQMFPGQPVDQYEPSWYAFEAGSERSEFYPSHQTPSDFVSPAEFRGGPGAVDEDFPDSDKKFAALRGDLDAASQAMVQQFFPTDVDGGIRVGAERRTEWLQNLPEPEEGWQQASPFFSVVSEGVQVTDDGGTLVAMGTYDVVAKYIDATTFAAVNTTVVEDDATWFAFKDPGNKQFPSVIWSLLSLVFFLLSMVWLDRIEQSEKHEQTDVVHEPENVKVPVAQ